ncbi:MAG TPA: pseudouridine synthase [Ktedonobacteraceae bacterium]|jgi:23S rRNA pseudouridine1911/1915/1917 synthase|nr:pseudouridine synthase [Ktedonobacteraceae bacterium]
MNTTDIAVVYQDHSLLILNKPAGIVIHPTYKHADGDTLWDALLHHLQQQPVEPWQAPDLPDDPEWTGAPEAVKVMLRERREAFLRKKLEILPRPCLLHRLDKDTSGVVALARTESARRHIIQQFHAHTIEKRYLALAQCVAPVWATPQAPLTFTRRGADGHTEAGDASALLTLAPADELVIDGPLQRDPVDRRRCIVGPDGQQAQTAVRVLAREQGYMLLEVRPITGRTHQIRAHLTAAGYSLVGDRVYAPTPVPGTPAATLQRQFLHAASLTLRNFPDNALCNFIAPLPPDLADWLARYMPDFALNHKEHNH